jgi:hypothetical protein
LYQRGSYHHHEEKENESLGDVGFLGPFGGLAHRDSPSFGNVLVKLGVSIADISGKRLNDVMRRRGEPNCVR